ncbi:MAG: SDR family oxidoreductase [Verrucomicrobiota bacterium]|jgi:short-subunit dehydrogenase
MNNPFNYSNSTALITGASSGIGAALAEALAQRGCRIVLSARDTVKLDAVAEQLRREHKVNVTIVPNDLSQSDGALNLHTEVVRRGLTIDLLVNNAGFGLTGPFLSHALSKEESQVQVNLTSPMALTHLFAPAMTEQRRGGIINIASLAAFQPQSNSAVYAASKSFLLLFSEALWLELEPHGVHMLAVCPGPVATNFFNRIGSKLPPQAISAERVASETLRAFDKKQAVLVPGTMVTRIQAFGYRVLPRAVVARIAARVSEKIMMSPIK